MRQSDSKTLKDIGSILDEPFSLLIFAHPNTEAVKMIMMLRKVLSFLPLLLILACQPSNNESNTSIQGRLAFETEEQLVIQELEVNKLLPIDSVKPHPDGSFNLSLYFEKAGFYVLEVADTNKLILLLEPYEQVNVVFDPDLKPLGYSVSGSPGSELLLDFDGFMLGQKFRLDSISEVYNMSRGDENFVEIKNVLDSVYDAIVEEQRKYVFRFLQQNPRSLASLIVLNRPLGKNYVVDEEDDFSYLYNLDSTLSEAYPGNKHVKDHSLRVKEIKGRLFDRLMAEEKVLPGRKAPDIVLNDTAGIPFSLKSYLGKPVLISFWAGWDAQSRIDNKELKSLAPSINNKGIEMLGVSLDKNHSVWKGALRLDQLPFRQVSDLKGFSSEVIKKYNIPENLPFYYLIDSDHKIFYKNHQLDSVLVKLDELTLQSK